MQPSVTSHSRTLKDKDVSVCSPDRDDSEVFFFFCFFLIHAPPTPHFMVLDTQLTLLVLQAVLCGALPLVSQVDLVIGM